MGEFFNGWRRKVGCVTLVMTMLLTAAWVRSCWHQDLLWIQTNEASYFAYSTDAAIVPWWHSDRRFANRCGWVTVEIRLPRQSGEGVEYWLLVLPLALLSAYLILWKPRKRKAESDA
jgi:hypothetical protein